MAKVCWTIVTGYSGADKEEVKKILIQELIEMGVPKEVAEGIDKTNEMKWGGEINECYSTIHITVID